MAMKSDCASAQSAADVLTSKGTVEPAAPPVTRLVIPPQPAGMPSQSQQIGGCSALDSARSINSTQSVIVDPCAKPKVGGV